MLAMREGIPTRGRTLVSLACLLSAVSVAEAQGLTRTYYVIIHGGTLVGDRNYINRPADVRE